MKSVSWPTALTMGTLEAATARTSASSLNAHKVLGATTTADDQHVALSTRVGGVERREQFAGRARTCTLAGYDYLRAWPAVAARAHVGKAAALVDVMNRSSRECGQLAFQFIGE